MPGCPPPGAVARALGVPGRPGLEEWARGELGCDPAHGWPHVVRVAGWARRIVDAEGLEPDWLVLYLAVVLHDVGRRSEARAGEHHAVLSARVAESLLPGMGLSMLVEPVRHAILAHSYSLGVRPRSLEARVLSDADKLDALGAVGIARVFHVGCERGRQFEEGLGHMEEKLLQLPALMHYQYSRRVARELAGRVRLFREWMLEELALHRVAPNG